MKLFNLIALSAMISGCAVYNRSVCYTYNNKAETTGTITNTPAAGNNSVNAEKTTDFDTAVSTSSGKAQTGDKTAKEATK